MTYNLFKEKVIDILNTRFFSRSVVKIEPIRKNNGIVLDAVLIINEEKVVLPCIYLNPYYTEYIQGIEIDTIVSEIIDTYNVAMMQKERINMETIEILNFDINKEKIFVKLINAQLNEEFLTTIPHERYLDLAVTYCLLCNETEEGISSITINSKVFEQWDCSLQELHDIALFNTENMFPVQIESMNDIIHEMTGVDPSILDNGGQSPSMYVMTNTRGINGASTLVYPNSVAAINKRITGNIDKVLILPSSIHELILVPVAGEEFDCNQLKSMIKEINTTQVMSHEILSNEVYCWFIKQNKVIRLEPGE